MKKTYLEQVKHSEYVNAEKKTVVSRLTSRICIDKLPYFKEWLSHNADWDKLKMEQGEDGFSHAYVYFETVGKAKCNENDTFDEVKGTHIALTRAQVSAFNKCKTFIHSITSELVDMLGTYTKIEMANNLAAYKALNHVIALSVNK